MCKCGQKSDGMSCDSNEQTNSAESELKKTGNCTDGQHKNGDCCSTKAA
jgi:hypothetical protein